MTPSDNPPHRGSTAKSHGTGMSREVMERGAVQELARARDGAASSVLSEEGLKQSRRQFLSDTPSEDLWVFGYGSLIWNPAIHFEERRDAFVYGYHRRFCLWTRIGRGSPECPGLVLGLDTGGSVHGQVFRISADIAADEADLLWKREMLNESYRPVWVRARTEAGEVRALAFVIRRDKPSYAPRMPLEKMAEAISQAVGFVGPCADYLFNTQKALTQAGIHDKELEQLVTLVADRRAD
ncbi:MAG: gamma-glutamylcyclotransferase [Candidatus Puniceispirillaceae bacterium]